MVVRTRQSSDSSGKCLLRLNEGVLLDSREASCDKKSVSPFAKAVSRDAWRGRSQPVVESILQSGKRAMVAAALVRPKLRAQNPIFAISLYVKITHQECQDAHSRRASMSRAVLFEECGFTAGKQDTKVG